MLTQLTIRNFAIVDYLDLDLSEGMTVITGETGAGKSIMLDALGLALGGRANNGVVRLSEDRAEIIASFDLAQIPEAQQWLTDHDLDQDNECILRRIVMADGRSKSYINGQPSPLSLIREVAQYLVDIHGQHEHQRLLKKDYHRQLLDEFAGNQGFLKEVHRLFKDWQQKAQTLLKIKQQSDDFIAQKQLLEYQVAELEQLGLGEHEIESLEQEQKRLANAHDILLNGKQLLQLTSENDEANILNMLNQCQQLMATLQKNDSQLTSASELINSASIQLEEAEHDIRQYLQSIEVNPQRLTEVEERLSSIYQLSRKHNCQPEELFQTHQQFMQQLESLQQLNQDSEALEQEVEECKLRYIEQAELLGKQRQLTAVKLAEAVNEQLSDLGMPAARLSVKLNALPEARWSLQGMEDLEFLISTNKGQPCKSLSKVASGGELSRISLAIQVITAQTTFKPTVIFDEVDVGIGGAIAEVVGRLLRKLSLSAQVFCVTHQPQVASQGHHHLQVTKEQTEQTTTKICQLTENQRIEEIARMLGGIEVTDTSIMHAREMLTLVE